MKESKAIHPQQRIQASTQCLLSTCYTPGFGTIPTKFRVLANSPCVQGAGSVVGVGDTDPITAQMHTIRWGELYGENGRGALAVVHRPQSSEGPV